MLLCSDSSSEDDGGHNFSGLARHREALAAGLPEWDDSQSQSSSSSSSLNQSGLMFNKFGSQSFRRGRCGSPHPRQMYSTRHTQNPAALLALKNLPSPPQATSPTGDGPLYSPQAKGVKMGNTNNPNSQGAKGDKSRIKMGIGKTVYSGKQTGHVEAEPDIKVKARPPRLVGPGSNGIEQQVTRVQVHRAAVTKLEKTKPLPGNSNSSVSTLYFNKQAKVQRRM